MARIEYMSEQSKDMPPGLYLGLFHGRDDPNERLDDWGFNGPMIGPIVGYHTTYYDHIRIGFDAIFEAQEFFPAATDHWVDLSFFDGMLVYEGKYYGDWTVFYHAKGEPT